MISGSLPLPTELLTILKPYIKTLLTQGLKFMIHELAVDFDKIEFNFQTNVQDENGSKPSDLQISNGMTNGKPAAVLFAEKLGMSVDSEETSKKQFNGAVNTNILGLFDVKLDTPGNNYAIGGATSANVNRMEGLLLNSVKIQDQAIALLKDHVTKPTDLVFLEIGGNDLFNMCRLFDTSNPTASEKGIEELMTQAMDNIKTTLLTLLNNNVKNIIIANAPDISLIPSYVVNENSSEDKKIMANKAHELSLEFNKRFNNIFEQLNTKYGNTMKMFDMANKFSEMLTEFKKGEDGVEGTSDDGIIDKASVDLGSGGATAANQFEGEFDKDGKSLNIAEMVPYVKVKDRSKMGFDMSAFSKANLEKSIENKEGLHYPKRFGSNHYNRYKEDIDLLVEAKMDIYRMSIS
ncbi:hypothetical protein FQR65_LT16447 [Abscondita terminalis]|nr:hypothetical protein FQR65_LT16447 [Abscondita terminalis]